jgi:RNA polymerase sigma factor (TIGR02999 family)
VYSFVRHVNDTIRSLITTADQGDAAAARTLFTTLYAELHRMARRELARRDGGSVGATSLLHEAYLQMAARDGQAFPDRARFMAYAARVMRGLIVDHARNRQAIKRGGAFEITSLSTEVADSIVDADELERIAEALELLAGHEPPLAEIVDLKFFCGFSFDEIAAMRGVSERTVQRQWEKARIYLHRTLKPPAGASPDGG